MYIPSPDPALLIKSPKNVKKVRKLIAGIKNPGCLLTPQMEKRFNDYIDKVKKELIKMDETEVLNMLDQGLWYGGA